MSISVVQLFIHKINLSDSSSTPISNPENGTPFKEYIDDILKIVSDSTDSTRFDISSNTTEVIASIKQIVLENNTSLITSIVNRLRTKELLAQAAIERMNIEIQPGILIQAHIEEHGVDKFIICKTEDMQFITENNYALLRGFPLKKKIIKSFLTVFDENDEMSQFLVSDTNTRLSTYWWKDFLELQKQFDDSYNTNTAFTAIDSKVLSPIRRTSLSDYYHLRNSTIRYFRAHDEFSLENYIQEAIGDYNPVDSAVININEIKTKIRELPNKHNFSNRFNIVNSEISARIKSVISLSPKIDLILKQDIEEGIIKAVILNDDQKYIQIRTDSGYNAFKESTNQNGNS